ncbi:hypothetical protein [Synechococcus sp. UW179A]|uniref:hypothetical protein n=1 Tax=Synechococcus sp. UW179A TaxID=2575510 RepID=UPI000E0F0A5E|nr:hypothetical protein [Synechococcus sp. UW179A]
MKSQRTVLLLLGIALVIATIVIHHLWGLRGAERLTSKDIYYVWEEGKSIADGVNPYARIIGKSLRDNNKYPTYLPLSYYFVAILDRIGFQSFFDFIRVWRPFNVFCHLGIAIVTFSTYNQQRKPISGLIACSILLLGRWSAYIVNVQHLEFAAILPILLAGQQLNRRPKFSALMFGLSLSVKHIGIILLPSFLLGLEPERVSSDKQFKGKQLITYGAIALAIPLIISIPFLLDQPSGFLLNVLFSTTRDFRDHGNATGTRMILTGVDGTRLLMVVLIAMNWIAQIKEKINFWFASTITLLIFLQFNAVIFAQYYIWLASFLLISCAFLSPKAIKQPTPTSTQ